MKKIFLLGVVLVASKIAYAQYVEPQDRVKTNVKPVETTSSVFPYYDRYFYVSLDINKPLTNTTWIGDISVAGFKGGYRKMINQRFSAGLDLNWSSYDQYQEPVTIISSTGAVHTDYFKYVYSYGIALTGQYYLKPVDAKKILPYVGLGLGAVNQDFVVYYNIYKDSETKWGFLARPEVGVLVPLSHKFGLMGAIHYDYATTRPSSYEYSGFTNVGAQIGLIFLTR